MSFDVEAYVDRSSRS